MSDCLKCGYMLPLGSTACLKCGAPNYLLIAKDLAEVECIYQNWYLDSLALWMRDGFACVYCGRDMLESYDVARHASATDHLLPVSKYQKLEDTAWNMVASCRACNSLKANFDPNYDPPKYVEGSRPTSDERSELIRRASEWIKTKRLAKEAAFEKERQSIKEVIHSLESLPSAK